MKRQVGLSLVELMIAIALGLIVLLAVTAIFANTSRGRTEMEKSNRQTENGRYASQLLMNNLRMAGYLAEFDPTPLASPAALPDPCATETNELIDALPLHVQGTDDAAVTPGCIDDLRAGTDILIVRRTSSCVAGAADCAAFADGTPHFQASLCAPGDGTELSAAISTSADYALNYFALSTSSSDFTRRKSDCVTPANIQRYHVHIYFIANNNESGDGIPTLKRAELGPGGFTVVPLVDGVENMQIEYGLDADGNGTPDNYTTAPVSVDDWRNAMSARVHLLVRNTEGTPGHTDSRNYTLGMNAGGGDKTVGPFGDNLKRHVYATTIRFANPSWRRQ